jgi:hypothetical protein
MPIFTFVCPLCKAERETVCSVADRDSNVPVSCEDPECGHFGEALTWMGIEGGQAHRPHGAYQFALKDSQGATVMRHKPTRGH